MFVVQSISFSISLFVNPTSGNDFTGDGSFGNPYKTIAKIGSILYNTHCDTIYILGTNHSGVKDEIYRSDSQNYWIYIRPYNNPSVTLSGVNSFPPDSWKAILGVQSSKYIDIGFINVTANDSASGFRVVSDDTTNHRISQFVNIRNCKANNCRRQGILIQASDVTVENCEIDSVCLRNKPYPHLQGGWDFALGCLLIPEKPYFQVCKNIVFRNNYVHNAWGEGIVVERERDFLIEDNRVSDCFSVCIYADKSRFGVIRRNWISVNGEYYNRTYDPTYIARASGIFWASENLRHQDSIITNIDIVNNFLYGTGPAFGWFDDEANSSIYDSYRKINIFYNTVFNTKSYMIFYIDTLNVNPSRIVPDNCNFKNNIICKAKWNNQYERYFTYSTDFITSWNVTNNCFIHGPDARFPNNITGAPSFLDSLTNYPDSFKIKATSNCRDTGVLVFDYNNVPINTDYWKAGRDNTPSIGFYEYGGIAGIKQIENEIAKEYSLSQNYPNPFNPNTNIEFAIPETAQAKLVVYDLSGKEVSILVNQQLSPGTYNYSLDGSNLSSGVYIYKLETENFVDTKKMILVK